MYDGGVGRKTQDIDVFWKGGTQNAESTEAGTEAESKAGFDARLVLIPLGAVFLGGAGYGGWRLMKYLRDKKRGYVK